MARYAFRCRDSGVEDACEAEFEDDNEDSLRATAEEHLRTDHPSQAVEAEKTRSFFAAGMRTT